MTDSRSYLRVGHAERDAAVADLQRAAAEGKLAPDELAERVALAGTARTYGDLDALFSDLQRPEPAQSPAPLQSVEQYPIALRADVPGAPVPPPAPGYSLTDPLVLSAGFSGAKRSGQWEVPPYLRAQALADNVKFDFLQATARSEVIDLEVLAGAGTVLLIVPEGWGVACDRLSTTWGSVKSSVPSQAAWGNPLVVARGSVGMGTFRARGANWFDRRRLGQDR